MGAMNELLITLQEITDPQELWELLEPFWEEIEEVEALPF